MISQLYTDICNHIISYIYIQIPINESQTYKSSPFNFPTRSATVRWHLKGLCDLVLRLNAKAIPVVLRTHPNATTATTATTETTSPGGGWASMW